MDQHRGIVVYGDFNCPFSALASARVGYLERHGLAEVDWRAVEHAPDIPSERRDLTGDQRYKLRGELDQIRGLLTDGEADQLTLPATVSSTRRATLAYAATPAVDRPRLRSSSSAPTGCIRWTWLIRRRCLAWAPSTRTSAWPRSGGTSGLRFLADRARDGAT